MARPPSKGAYAPLAAQYYLDDTILEAGPAAELMWVRVLSFLASVATDGYITERQMKTVGNGLRDWRQRVVVLQQVGLLTPVSGGYVARSWLKWNRTTAEQNKLLAKDRDRKASKQAEKAQNSARNETAFRSDSAARTEQNRTEQLKDIVHPSAERAREFDEWWAIYPKKQAKEAARRKYLTVRKKVPADVLLRGVREYALLMAGEDKQFVKLPAGWLNDGRWADDHSTAPGAPAAARTPERFCTIHDGYPLPCASCARAANGGNDF